MRRILIVEDEPAINRLLVMNLSAAGYLPAPEYDGAVACRRIQSGEPFDLALLDVMLPGMDGFSLLPPLRKRGIPAICLTARGDIESKVQGLRDGAEDYIVKPFEILELLVRIEKVLERSGAARARIRIGAVEICREERIVLRDGVPVSMTPIQFDLLSLLAINRNIALSREQLLSAVWGSSFVGESRTVDIHISQLRRKTGLPIVSVPKVGYRLEAAP